MQISISAIICLTAALLVFLKLFRQRIRSVLSLRTYAVSAVSFGSFRIYALAAASAALFAEICRISGSGSITALVASAVLVCLSVPVLRLDGNSGNAGRVSGTRSFTADLLLLALSFWFAMISVFSRELSAYFGGSPARGLLHFTVMQYPVFLCVMLCYIAACCIRKTVIKAILLTFLTVFLLLVISDFVVMRELSTRVIISEILSFTDGIFNSSAIITHFSTRIAEQQYLC